MNFRGRRVLLTGASSGLGRELALQLARVHGAELVLVARRAERLAELAREIGEVSGTRVTVKSADLSKLEEVERVFREATAEGGLYAVILNAGVTHFGHHDELSFEAFEEMVALNVRGTARLLSLCLPHLEAQAHGGGALIVASLSGLTPAAYQSAYSGTKGFLVKYGWALHHEMKPRGVTVSVYAPGGIVSEMTAGARFDALRSWLMPTPRAARAALRGFARRRPVIIPGFVYGWGRSVVLKLFSENFLVAQTARTYRASLARRS